jgi:hypothetical protein
MGWRRRRDGRYSDAGTTAWTKRLLWGFLIACAAALIFCLVRALWHFMSVWLRIYAEAGKP